VLVTHDQEEALSMADQVVVMNRGEVEQTGAPHEIYTTPANLFVAGFIGEASLLPITVVSAADGVVRAQCGSTVLHLAGSQVSAPGTRGTLVLRSEDMRLVDADEPATDAVNVVEGLVRESTYLGAMRQYRVTGVSDADVIFRLPGNRGAILREGQRVRIAWPADAGSFCPEGPST
jgi:ABC-type Fe3+/spermidine/putrescine transport system ATPase subunit